MNKKNSLSYNTFLSALANIVTRFLGFFYRIFLGRFIGAEGMGLHGLIMPVYQICCTVIASGLPTANLKLVSECVATRNTKGVRIFMRVSLLIVAIISLFLALCVLLFSKPISLILGDTRTRLPLAVLSAAILITGFENIYKSYFYCVGRAKIPSSAEITEQLVRITFVVCMLLCFHSLTLSHSIAIIVGGIAVGETVSSVFLFLSYRRSLKSRVQPIKKGHIMAAKSLLSVAAPITCTKLFTTVIQSITNIFVPSCLVFYGLNYTDALSVFGVLTGMVMPLLFLPYTLTNALSVNLVPYISSKMAVGNSDLLCQKLSQTISAVSSAAFCISAALCALSTPVGLFLYNEPLVGEFLPVMAVGTVFNTLGHIFSSMLNGMDGERKSSLYMSIGSVLSLVLTLTLTPKIGIFGYIVGFIACSVLVCVLDFIEVLRLTDIRTDFTKWLFVPLVFGLFTFFASFLIYSFLSNITLPVTSLILSGGASGLICLFALLWSLTQKNRAN